jgi:hypothetical protein
MTKWLLVALAGCGMDAAPPPGPDAAGLPVSSEVPPQGHDALKSWLADGHYLDWACEAAAHPARPPGAHGSNRICSNAALSASASGTFPVGAASVKELYRDTQIIGYAVGVKLSEGDDIGSWYWYEAVGNSVYADGVNRGICTGCHSDAARDYVFTRVE